MLDIEKIRKDFPMLQNNKDLVYFDNAATSFKPTSVINAVTNYYEHLNTNIHRGDYEISYKVSTMYEKTRETLKEFLNAKDSKEIVFTSGDTASLNTIAFGYIKKHFKSNDVILTSHAEHASDILPMFNTGLKIEYIKLNEDGTFNLDNYRECFKNKNIKIVCLTYVSNVLGYINPIKEIVKIAHENGALVSIDAAQAAPHIKIDVQDLDVDFLSFSSHKMLGPSGVGVLYGKYNLLQDTNPVSFGGGSNARFYDNGEIILKDAPTKFESGTPNIEGVLGLDAACKYLMNLGLDKIHEYDSYLLKYALDKLSKLENVTVYNPKSECGIIAFNINGIFAQDAAQYLSKNNIAVRSGNHCAKILDKVIGTSETIRASLYFYNTIEEVDKFIDVVKNTTLENCIGAVI